MEKQPFSWKLFEKTPIVGIIRNVSMEDVIQILPIYRAVGLTTIEITMNTPNAEQIIKYAIDNEQQGLNIGAGTIFNKKDLKRALDAGAQFIVTPIVNKKVIKASVKNNIPIFSGAFTPTEIYQAWTCGASMVKIFPAKQLGANYIKELKAPMTHIKLLPTGGIGLHNMSDFLKNGANGLGIGGQLFDNQLIKDKNWEELKNHFLKFVNKLNKSA